MVGSRPPNHVLDGPSFDDVLGPGSERYFASGYARVARGFRDCLVETAGGRVIVTATCCARYPADWSVKKRGTLTPHLSSIDAIIFSELLVARSLSATAAMNGRTRRLDVRRVELRAGSAPHRKVEAIPSRVEVERAPEAETAIATCQIGTLRVRLTFRHPEMIASQDVGLHQTAYLGDEEAVSRSPDVQWSTKLGTLSPDGMTLTARHVGRAVASTGANGVPTISFVDLLRLSAQQAQVLIYERDGLSRAVTQTMWMRRATFSATASYRPASPAFDLRVRIAREATLDRSEVIWRLFDVEADGAPAMRASASLAYRSA